MGDLNEQVLPLIKARLNRLPGDTTLDEYLTARADSVISELARTGISINLNDLADVIFVTDVVVWQYQNRDSPGSMPDWLRLRRRERWLQEQRGRG